MNDPAEEPWDARRNFGPSIVEVREAREFTCATISTWGFNPDYAEIVVNELSINAVAHGRSPFTVELKVDDHHIRIAVQDENSRFPSKTFVPLDAHSGRGLSIVEGLSADWGVDPLPGDGKVVWAILEAREESPIRMP